MVVLLNLQNYTWLKRLTSSNLTALMHYFALNNDEAEDTFKVSILKYFLISFHISKIKIVKIKQRKISLITMI